ncbi:hypothetical protein FBEOM_4206 [Fusarium beomiforme]|uniref:WSC domain-containing protein n=1 Tax=Fusarium beomiforme TaxID=44412 RepID=A0A9P5ANL6_9HYPO|nr:hypothetical protein FBEOM_4206 [Fusarium beomiforme]
MARFTFLHAALFFWVALVAAQSVDPAVIKHKGCYRERSLYFVLAGYSTHEADRRKCLDVCRQRGQPWVTFGVVNCYCSDVAPASYHQVDNNRCNARCLGILDGDCVEQPQNNAFKDEKFYSVYSINIPAKADGEYGPSTHRTPRPSIQPTKSTQLTETRGKVGKITAQGCYHSSAGLSFRKNVLMFMAEEAPRECARQCGGDKKPFAFMKRNDCYCGERSPPSDLIVGSYNCYMPCLSDEDDRCQREAAYATSRQDRYVAVYDTGLDVDVKAEDPLFTSQGSEDAVADHTKPNGHPGQACYTKVPANSISKIFRRNNPSLCHRFCQRKGRMYAFMQDQICHCSNEYPDKDDELPASRCNIQCPGTALFDCGGDNNAYSVYNLGPERSSTIEPKPISQIERCFYDLPMAADHIPLDTGAVSKLPSSCIDSCKAIGKGVAFIKGSQCHCAQGYPRSASTTDLRECQIPCTGNAQYSCGGYGVTRDTFSAYRTGYTLGRHRIQQESNNKGHMQRPYQEPRFGHMTSHGCYNLQSTTLTHKKLESSNTMEQCSNYCKREDKPVAAVQRGWCLCSDTYPAKSAKVDDAQCANWCPGWSREACGGRRTWSVINTGITVNVADDEPNTKQIERPVKISKPSPERELPKIKSHGCFKLPGFLSYPRAIMNEPNRSPNRDSCNHHCTVKGYSVALRHGSKCFCNNKLPEESARLDDDKCWFTSIFDTREQCGGPDDAYSVYRLDSNLSEPEEESEEAQKGDNPSNSPVQRPQCLHHGMERIYETSSWVINKIADFAQKVQDAFTGFLDKAQDVFDACLWRIMVVFSDLMYSLGWVSSSGDVDL